MKKDEIISVKSTLGKTRKKPEPKGRKHNEINFNEDNTEGLRKAMVILPIVIIGIIVVALIVGINQYTSTLAGMNMSSETESSTDEAKCLDDKKLLMIVSPDSPLPSDYKTDLISYDGQRVDSGILDDLKKMIEAANRDGISLKIVEGYVSAEVQHERYMDEVRQLMAREGYGEARAMEEAEKTVPMEDHSELQSGLAVRFGSLKGSDFEQTEEYRWLFKNSIKYGFILRYPEGKELSTDFSFDPTHFRYVGIENASRMRSLNMTLDEYVTYLNSRD